MKRILLTLLAVAFVATLSAQNYIVVNSEKIFKSIDAYNTALQTLDKESKEYQKQVDEKFSGVETLYNNYIKNKESFSASSQQFYENKILEEEKEASKFQESIFGENGTILKRRVELIQPIQERVFKAIEQYATSKGFDLVIDVAQNAQLLYYSPKADHTQAIINLLK